MPKSKSRPTVRAAFSGGLPAHPGVRLQDPLLQYRLGSEEPLRLPDLENAPSCATVLRSEITYGSDAAGALVFSQHPPLASASATYTVTAGSTGTATTAAHPQLTALSSEARYARMIGMKITVTYIGVEQEAAGFLSYFAPFSGADVSTTALDALHTGALVQVRATEGLEVFVDFTQQPRYETPSDTEFMKATFPVAAFVCSGLPASKTSLFRVRVSRFMEYLPLQGALAEGETRHEPHNPGALAVHGELSGPGTSIRKGSDTTWVDRVKAAANAAYHLAQPMLPYVVPKAREFLTNVAMGAMKAAPLLL